MVSEEWQSHGLSLTFETDNNLQVSLGNMKSTTSVISYVVPEESAVGSLLFLLHMNDFQNSSRVLDFHLESFLCEQERCSS